MGLKVRFKVDGVDTIGTVRPDTQLYVNVGSAIHSPKLRDVEVLRSEDAWLLEQDGKEPRSKVLCHHEGRIEEA